MIYLHAAVSGLGLGRGLGDGVGVQRDPRIAFGGAWCGEGRGGGWKNKRPCRTVCHAFLDDAYCYAVYEPLIRHFPSPE